MFSFFQIGILEVLSAFVVTCAAAFLFFVFKRPTAWRWLAVIVSALIIAMVFTPADPLSMWLVATTTCAVFAAGVYLSPYLGRPTGTVSSG